MWISARYVYSSRKVYDTGPVLKNMMIGHKEIVLKSDYFTCDMCDYKTVKFSCLSNHKREHQYKSSAKPMCCFICSYKTPWGNMVKHLKDHQNALGLYNCPCGYQEKKKKLFPGTSSRTKKS
ncbi:hypothetical protein NQ317_007893 [Molorchus minor]|uniref:C2H2-type domain-containing protein n=1 Tax=Molorchus minor TaxID=1323400 RepID=A0ABQ9JSY7_9CUCU|nr:hypothetical protein NQ317_007893 [Molorchus minor]